MDAQYQADENLQTESAYVAGVLFSGWQAEQAEAEYLCRVSPVAEYDPGAFYRRELPCILQLLTQHQLRPDLILVDGYVDLDSNGRPGLGRHLYRALNESCPVLGVAKRPFAGISPEHEVRRGQSTNPLYVTTTGDLAEAKIQLRSMAGAYRIPTLLKQVDQLCRAFAKENAAINNPDTDTGYPDES